MSKAAAALIALMLTAVLPATAQNLYGVTENGTIQLLTINTADGTACGGPSFSGGVSLPAPVGLTADANSGSMSLMDRTRQERFGLDPNTGVTFGPIGPIPLPARPQRGLATDAFTGDLYYCRDSDASHCTLAKESGSLDSPVTQLNYASLTSLAFNPTDRMLYGVGKKINDAGNYLFKIRTDGNGFQELGRTVYDTRTGTCDMNTSVCRDCRCSTQVNPTRCPDRVLGQDAPVVGLEFHRGSVYGAGGTNLACLLTMDIPAAPGAIVTVHPAACTFGPFGAIADLASVTPPFHSDIWIKDCERDTGIVPSTRNCPRWWTSHDIWIDNNDDGVIDAPVESPANCRDPDCFHNHIYAFVRNRGTGFAQNVTVRFFYADGSMAVLLPDTGTQIGQVTVNIPPNAVVQVGPIDWVEPPSDPSHHWCLGVVLESADDPRTQPPRSPEDDNNIAIANLWSIAGRAGERTGVSFTAGTSSTAAVVGRSPKDWPREFVLRVENQLPTGWTWFMTGPIQPDRPFTLKLGQEKSVLVTVAVSADTVPRSGGFVEVKQVDVATGRVVGAVNFDLYEDHLAPQRVSEIRLGMSGQSGVLTWQPVLKEENTDLTEHVAYYEVLRDGKVVAKTLGAKDPMQPGLTWKDPNPLQYGTTYNVRAVDEAGNVSAVSPAATVTLPIKLFNWLTWLLLMLLLVCLLLLLFRSKKWLLRIFGRV